MGWQVALAGVCYLTASQVQGLAILHSPEASFENWQTALMTMAVAICAVLFNTILVRHLPSLEFLMLLLRKSAKQMTWIHGTDVNRLRRLLRLRLRACLHGPPVGV